MNSSTNNNCSDNLYSFHFQAKDELNSVRKNLGTPATPWQGRVWCAVHSVSHMVQIPLKPLIYSVSALAVGIFKLSAGQAVNLLGSAVVSPWVEVQLAYKSLKGIIAPADFYQERLASAAHAAIGATYQTDGKGIIDVAYASTLGFGYVADFKFHNVPEVHPLLSPVFSDFNQHLAESFARNFSTRDEAVQLLNDQLAKLAIAIGSDTTLRDYAPAFALAQIVQVNKEKILLTTRCSDVTILINSKGRWEKYIEKEGTRERRIGEPCDDDRVGLPQAFCFPSSVVSGDEIIAFTDGIGEYLTEKEFMEVLSKNTNRANLMQELKEHIIQHGNEVLSDNKGINGQPLRVYKANDKWGTDDLGLMTLTVA